MADEHRLATIIPSLLDLGMTRLEAEVYLACLELAAAGPISSYRVAKAMGRDPANAGKVLNALVKQTAVRVVQEKPRLYLPLPLAEFSDRVLERIRERRDEAVRRLTTLTTPPVAGLALSLSGREPVLETARELLAGCRSRVLVFGSGDVVRDLGRALEDAAEERAVFVLSPLAFSSETVRIATLPDEPPFAVPEAASWLHLVVDDASWLTAVAADGGEWEGWWAAASPLAPVLAMALQGAWRMAADDEARIEAQRETAELRAALEALRAAETVAAEPATASGFTAEFMSEFTPEFASDLDSEPDSADDGEPAAEPAAAASAAPATGADTPRETAEPAPAPAAAETPADSPTPAATSSPPAEPQPAEPTLKARAAAAGADDDDDGVQFLVRRPRETEDDDTAR